jgi:hypothetical protein
MKAAVLCPGPSAYTFPGRDGYDMVIGVNRAAGLAPCDYWVMLDGVQVWKISAPVGRPKIICGHPSHLDLWRNIPEAREHGWFDIQECIQTLPEAPITWAVFSATAAIVTAIHLGAKSVDIWGADMKGIEDFDGLNMPGMYARSEMRWQKEARILHELTEHFAAKGITIQRCFAEVANANPA